MSKPDNDLKDLPREEAKLVEYFRRDGYEQFGAEGDYRGWSPAETAIAAMRELATLRAARADAIDLKGKQLSQVGRLVVDHQAGKRTILIDGFKAKGCTCREVAALALQHALVKGRVPAGVTREDVLAEFIELLRRPGGTGNVGIGR